MDAYRASTASARTLAPRTAGAVLCLAVSVIHVVDQGGVPGAKDPYYVGVGFHALEIAGLLVAALLLVRGTRPAWLLAAGVAFGPLLGYVLSRGPGLPHYSDDVGNWGEPLGVVSLVVEGVLLVLSVAMLYQLRPRPAIADRDTGAAAGATGVRHQHRR